MKLSLDENIYPFLGILAVVIGVLMCVHLAAAHDWYPAECCSGEETGGDCRKVSVEDMEESDKGLLDISTDRKQVLWCSGQTIPG